MSSFIIEIAQFSTQNELQIAIATARDVNGEKYHRVATTFKSLFFCKIIHSFNGFPVTFHGALYHSGDIADDGSDDGFLRNC
jgi:hypothetical protein